jgi:hypothetical protein
VAATVTHPVAGAAPPPGLWRRRRFAVALLAALAVLLGGLVYLALGVDVGGGSPSGTAVTYLQALARGDARAALGAGAAPKDRSLLTGTVLREQQKLAPISGIRVLGTRTGDYGAVVHVAYRVGGQQVDDHLNVIHADGDWRLASVAVDVEITGGSALPNVTVFDKRISTRNDVFVFPGAIRFGSGDASFDITPATAVFSSPDIPALLTLGSSLTAQGRKGGADAMIAALQKCAQSRSLTPARCPQHAARPAGAVSNSWHWAVSGIEGASFSQNQRSPRRFTAKGTAVWTLTYQVVVKRKKVTRTLPVRTPVTGVLDFSRHPAVFTVKR